MAFRAAPSNCIPYITNLDITNLDITNLVINSLNAVPRR